MNEIDLNIYIDKFNNMSPKEQEMIKKAAIKLKKEFDEMDEKSHLISNNIDKILSKIDYQFDELIKFNRYDWTILTIASVLQCVRQLLLTKFPERVNDKEAAKDFKIKNNNKREIITHGWYHPSLEEIISKPVPFDTVAGSKRFGIGLNGNHRFYTLGHDPILGYVFGTMNILTSTITLSNLESFHVKDNLAINKLGISRVHDLISNRAQISKIVYYSKSRLFDEGKEGKIAFAYALVKEYIHLQSDIKSHKSLPLPTISYCVSGEFAQELSDYGFDTLNLQSISKQALFSVLINFLISSLHRLIKPNNITSEYYRAKTLSILLFSNLIASEINLLYTGFSNNIRNLDLGGLIVTLWRLIKDFDSIEKIRQKFKNEYLIKLIKNSNIEEICQFLQI